MRHKLIIVAVVATVAMATAVPSALYARNYNPLPSTRAGDCYPEMSGIVAPPPPKQHISQWWIWAFSAYTPLYYSA